MAISLADSSITSATPGVLVKGTVNPAFFGTELVVVQATAAARRVDDQIDSSYIVGGGTAYWTFLQLPSNGKIGLRTHSTNDNTGGGSDGPQFVDFSNIYIVLFYGSASAAWDGSTLDDSDSTEPYDFSAESVTAAGPANSTTLRNAINADSSVIAMLVDSSHPNIDIANLEYLAEYDLRATQNLSPLGTPTARVTHNAPVSPLSFSDWTTPAGRETDLLMLIERGASEWYREGQQGSLVDSGNALFDDQLTADIRINRVRWGNDDLTLNRAGVGTFSSQFEGADPPLDDGIWHVVTDADHVQIPNSLLDDAGGGFARWMVTNAADIAVLDSISQGDRVILAFTREAVTEYDLRTTQNLSPLGTGSARIAYNEPPEYNLRATQNLAALGAPAARITHRTVPAYGLRTSQALSALGTANARITYSTAPRHNLRASQALSALGAPTVRISYSTAPRHSLRTSHPLSALDVAAVRITYTAPAVAHRLRASQQLSVLGASVAQINYRLPPVQPTRILKGPAPPRYAYIELYDGDTQVGRIDDVMSWSVTTTADRAGKWNVHLLPEYADQIRGGLSVRIHALLPYGGWQEISGGNIDRERMRPQVGRRAPRLQIGGDDWMRELRWVHLGRRTINVTGPEGQADFYDSILPDTWTVRYDDPVIDGIQLSTNADANGLQTIIKAHEAQQVHSRLEGFRHLNVSPTWDLSPMVAVGKPLDGVRQGQFGIDNPLYLRNRYNQIGGLQAIGLNGITLSQSTREPEYGALIGDILCSPRNEYLDRIKTVQVEDVDDPDTLLSFAEYYLELYDTPDERWDLIGQPTAMVYPRQRIRLHTPIAADGIDDRTVYIVSIEWSGKQSGEVTANLACRTRAGALENTAEEIAQGIIQAERSRR